MSLFKHEQSKPHLIKCGILGAILELVYIIALITIGNQVSEYSRAQNIDNPILGPILVLTVFVFSAAVSAILILGYPTYLLLIEKRVKEAIIAILTTLATLLILGIVIFVLLIAI